MWIVQAQFAGYALARLEHPGLELVPRQAGTTPLDELLEGRAEFCLASPAHLLAAGARSRSAVLVGLFMSRSPVVLVGSRRRIGADLRAAAGARIGVWPGEELEIVAMLAAAGVQRGHADLVPVEEGFDAFAAGELDLLQATTYNELPALRRLLPDPSDLVIHEPTRWGVDVAKDGLVTRRDLLAEDRATVNAVVAASVRGWHRARQDRDAAVTAVHSLDPTLDEAEQREQLDLVLELFDPDQPLGRPSAAEIERAARVHHIAGRGVDPAAVLIDAGPWERAAGA